MLPIFVLMKILVFLALFVSSVLLNNMEAQNTPWDILYCLNGGENKSMGISPIPFPNPPEKPGWNLIFSDEFITDSLNPERWNRSTPGDDKYGECLRGFAINPKNIVIENGSAKIFNSIDQQMPGCPYSFGEIKTMSVRDTAFKSYYFYAPGYLETRVKLFTKTGQGAACWLWGIGTPENPGTPGPWNEIDVFELNGVNNNIFNGAYHWTYNGTHVSQSHNIYLTNSGQPYDLSVNWTTFGLEWDTTSIKWFVNNQLVKELDLTKIPPFCIPSPHYNQPVAPFCVRFNSGYNTVGNQSGIPNAADFPQAMFVDYVRMYKKTSSKASSIAITDEQNQICATATSPETSQKTISSPYYPNIVTSWTSPGFEMKKVLLPIPQPPDEMLIWKKPNITAGQSYPIFLEAHFPSGYSEYDTISLYISPDVPALPSDEFVPSQVDSQCRFAIKTPVHANIFGCDYSLDNGLTWLPGTIHQQGGISTCNFGTFKPGQQVDFAFREQNSCGYSPVLYSSRTMPDPPTGCQWPAGLNDSVSNQTGTAHLLFSIRPNPVINNLFVQLPPDQNQKSLPLQVEIFDVHARLVFCEPISRGDTKLDLSRLTPGTYCILVLANNAIVCKSVFLKK